MNTLENAFLEALAADLRVETEQAPAAKAAVNPRTGKEYESGISLEPAMGALEESVGAGIKGAAQGFVGLPGDIISLARGLYDLGKSGGDLDALLAGLDKPTGLPTTKDLKEALDNIGLKMGSGQSPTETIGEVASPGGYVEGAKRVSRAVKKATRNK
jgi:hypothetical protein